MLITFNNMDCSNLIVKSDYVYIKKNTECALYSNKTPCTYIYDATLKTQIGFKVLQPLNLDYSSIVTFSISLGKMNVQNTVYNLKLFTHNNVVLSSVNIMGVIHYDQLKDKKNKVYLFELTYDTSLIIKNGKYRIKKATGKLSFDGVECSNNINFNATFDIVNFPYITTTNSLTLTKLCHYVYANYTLPKSVKTGIIIYSNNYYTICDFNIIKNKVQLLSSVNVPMQSVNYDTDSFIFKDYKVMLDSLKYLMNGKFSVTSEYSNTIAYACFERLQVIVEYTNTINMPLNITFVSIPQDSIAADRITSSLNMEGYLNVSLSPDVE